MDLGSITFQQLIAALIVFFILVEGYNKIMSAVKTHRTEKEMKEKPVKDLETRLESYDNYFALDDDRFEKIEDELARIKIENQLILRGVLSLNRHGIDGNNIAALKEMTEEIQNYLIEK